MFRIGTGFDVHAFKPGNKIHLCGIEIPFDKSLAGHSDADVALHALTDAILGALALGDIGQHFPDSDKKWKGADSVIFLWAKAEIRAQRRYLQLKKFSKTNKYNDILKEILFRDMRDMNRKTAPLRPAADSYLIDNSNLDIEQCFNRILKIIRKN